MTDMEHSTPAEADAGKLPVEYFEQLAAGQRRSVHNSISRLRSAATNQIRQRLDVNRNLRQHFWPAASTAAVVALVLGYNVAGIFRRD
jgi:cytolysin (calcineurin-like family phosphatase)